ncbi:MAG: hypothetical protein R3B47_00510 [Bacteroidia bacterium]
MSWKPIRMLLKGFPKAEKSQNQSPRGVAFLQKNRHFSNAPCGSYPEETTWHALLSVDEVKAMLKDIKEGNVPESLGN